MKKTNCLSCGGQMPINLNQSTAQCPFCGNVYFINNLLDQTPICPICNKNDRVVEAGSITKDDPKYKTLRFNIKDFYLPDEEPVLDDHSKTIGVLGWVMVIVPLILMQFFASRLSNQSLGFLVPLGISIILGVGLFLYAVNQYNSVKAKKAQQEKIHEALKELNKVEFNRLKPIYERLYYCRRDDKVFLPSEGDYSAPEEMRKYLREHV